MVGRLIGPKTCSCAFAISLVLASLASGGCSSTTTINSEPSGAKVYVEGELIGTAPVQYSDKAIVGTERDVRLELDGYQPLTTSFSRNGDANVGAIVGGIFLLFPFLWTLNYDDQYTFQLQPISSE